MIGKDRYAVKIGLMNTSAIIVIARAVFALSNLLFRGVDCFAALAMTMRRNDW